MTFFAGDCTVLGEVLTGFLTGFCEATFFADTSADLDVFKPPLERALGLIVLRGAFFNTAFLALVAGLAGFPEGFRLEEVLVDFFNGAQLVPKSRAVKDR